MKLQKQERTHKEQSLCYVLKFALVLKRPSEAVSSRLGCLTSPEGELVLLEVTEYGATQKSLVQVS